MPASFEAFGKAAEALEQYGDLHGKSFGLESKALPEASGEIKAPSDPCDLHDAGDNKALLENTIGYDDKGKVYRIENDLLPNTSYELNGYQYKTDARGRIVSASGRLRLKEREGRKGIVDSLEVIGKGDERPGDDRGHLIGDRFDGNSGLGNLIPQDAKINQGDYKKLENKLAKDVTAGRVVSVAIVPKYNDSSHRPSHIVFRYTIDGNQFRLIVPNESQPKGVMDK